MSDQKLLPPNPDERVREVEAENAFFRIALTHIYNDLTTNGHVTQPAMDMLTKATGRAQLPTNRLFEELKALHEMAAAAGRVVEAHFAAVDGQRNLRSSLRRVQELVGGET